MPELPDVEVYAEALRRRCIGRRLDRVLIRSPSLLRSVEPPIESIEGRRATGVERSGKRLVFAFGQAPLLVLHLMIAGRFRWFDEPRRPAGTIDLAALHFEGRSLLLTEASKRRRATIRVLASRDDLGREAALDVRSCDLTSFAARLRLENRTLKRALTNPAAFDGIGNAYSDEILHLARLSPLALTRSLDDERVARLHEAARSILIEWTARLLREFGLDRPGELGRFPGPGDITAFRPDMAVHGKFGRACPDCGSLVQRIVYAENETNYCARCQTGGRILADRDLSRLLRDEYPRHLDE